MNRRQHYHQQVLKYAAEELGDQGKVTVRMGRIDGLGVYSTRVILTTTTTIEYYVAFTDGFAISIMHAGSTARTIEPDEQLELL